MNHCLVVGGTGMLRGVCLELARRGAAVSVIARSHAGLSSLAASGAGLLGSIHPLPVDYRDDQALAAAVRTARTARGPIDPAVCWVHDEAPRALSLVAAMIADERRPAGLLHVAGCEALGPERAMRDRPDLRALAGIAYRRVVLGWMGGACAPRWLTHQEICGGVLGAIGSGETESVVGNVTPWSDRP